MKKILLPFAAFLVLFSAAVNAQTFTVAGDTVRATVGGAAAVTDNVTNTAYTSGLVVKWHVIDCDFPDDWLTPGAFGICDNYTCRYNTGDTLLWNKTVTPRRGTTFTSSTIAPYYAIGTPGLFDVTLDLSSATSMGSHYVTVALTDTLGSGYTKNVTFVINKVPTGIPSLPSTNEISVYPNPATNELNVVYDANADVKNIAVYNIIGKVMSVFKVTGDSANLNIDAIPSGIYFVRLYSGDGHVVAIKKFTKQ